VKVLLAEDDNTLRDTLRELLELNGMTVVAVGNGAAALTALDEGGFGAAVLDGLMPKQSGFDVAVAMKQRMPSVAVVLMSGVVKAPSQQQEQMLRSGAKTFLVKPFDVNRLLEVLKPLATKATQAATQRAVSTSPLPASGGLLECPPVYLGWRIHGEQHSGILDLVSATGARARWFCIRGRCVFAQHSDPMLNLGIELMRDGVLSAEQHEQAVVTALAKGIGLYEVLRTDHAIAEAVAKASYRTLVPKIIGDCAAWSGTFRFQPTEAFAPVLPMVSASVWDSLMAGLRQRGSRELGAHVEPRAVLRLAPGDQWDAITTQLAQACGSDSLATAINGRATVAELLHAAIDSNDLAKRQRQVYLLMSTMAVRASMEPMSMAVAAVPPRPLEPTPQPLPVSATPQPLTPQPAVRMSTPVPVAAPDRSNTPMPIVDTSGTPADRTAREMIETKWQQIAKLDHWKILGVSKSADAAALRSAYLQLAREFHTDAFATVSLGDSQRTLDRIFARVQEAYDTLSDANLRREYEAKASLEAQGGSSDVAAIFGAEAEFAKVRVLVERGELAGAQKLIGKCASVLAVHEEVQGFKLFLDWWVTKDHSSAESVVRKLQELHKRAAASVALVDFQGWIWMESGNLKLSRACFRRALEIDPKHMRATLGNRTLQKKLDDADKEANTSTLGKLFRR
jgi:CheY-like chemotaxis protein/DnaJ-domain-containing protein 1